MLKNWKKSDKINNSKYSSLSMHKTIRIKIITSFKVRVNVRVKVVVNVQVMVNDQVNKFQIENSSECYSYSENQKLLKNLWILIYI